MTRNKKLVLGGCGCLSLFTILIIIGIGSIGYVGYNKVKVMESIVNYNEETLAGRDEISLKADQLTSGLLYATTAEISETNGEFKEAIFKFEDFVNTREIPDGAENLKTLNLEYVGIARDIADTADQIAQAINAGQDTINLKQQYDSQIDRLNDKNEEISKELKKFIGDNISNFNDLNEITQE